MARQIYTPKIGNIYDDIMYINERIIRNFTEKMANGKLAFKFPLSYFTMLDAPFRKNILS